MSLIDKFHVSESRNIRRDDFGNVEMELSRKQKDINEIGNIAHQFGFILEARVAVAFYANKAQVSDATKNAEKMIQREIYGDLINPVLELQCALFARDIRKCDEAMGKIKKEIGL